MNDANEQKRLAAEYAAGLVADGMIVGLGSGTTAEKAVDALGRRYRDGLRFTGVATSPETERLARLYGIPLVALDELSELDLAIDGADEVDPKLDLIKGHGGQLVREKLVAASARQFVVIVDQSKLVTHLGDHSPIPVEVITFGWTTTKHRLESLGLECVLRGEDRPFITSNHNYVLDCRLSGTLAVAGQLGTAIKEQTGVVDHGLFLNMATTVVAGSAVEDVRVMERRGAAT